MHPSAIQPRKRTEYKKPRRINAVSVTLILIFGVLAFWVFHTYPVFILRLRAKSELQEMLPQLWRANLIQQTQSREIPRIKKELLERLHKAGVRDPKVEIVIERNKKVVALEAHFMVAVFYPVIDKTHAYHLAPRAQTDAARVDW